MIVKRTEQSPSVHRGGGTLQAAVWGAKALTFCELSKKGVCMPHEKRNSQSSGAMEEVSGKSLKASTHSRVLVDVGIAECDTGARPCDVDASSLRAQQTISPLGRWMKFPGRFKCKHLLHPAQRGVDGGVT